MIKIIVKDESTIAFENALKAFKKACQKDGFMMELKERRFYSKPSDKRREKIKRFKRK